MIDGSFVSMGAWGYPVGAVRVGGRWVPLKAGNARFNAERTRAWLERTASGGRPAAALVGGMQPQGGLVALEAAGVPVHPGPQSAEMAEGVRRGRGGRGTGAAPVAVGRWLRVGSDSLWIEPVDLVDAHGSLLVYVPALRWAYTRSGGQPAS